MTKKKALDTDDLFLELENIPEKGGWIVKCPSGMGIPASVFEVCLWNEILRLRSRVVYLKKVIELHEQV